MYLPRRRSLHSQPNALPLVCVLISVAYVASKHAVVGSAALEHAGKGIRVNAVAPGFTQTDLLTSLSNGGEMLPAKAGMVPFKRLARPQEIAESIVWLLSDRAS